MDSKQIDPVRRPTTRPANSAGQWFYGVESEPFHMHQLPDRRKEESEFDEDELLPKPSAAVRVVHRPFDFILGTAMVLTGIVISPMVMFPERQSNWWLMIGLVAWGAHHLFRGSFGVVMPRVDREADPLHPDR